MTKTKARDEAAAEFVENNPSYGTLTTEFCFTSGYDKAIEHVLKVVGEFSEVDARSAAIQKYDSSYTCMANKEFIDGARHQHDQIIKKIKAASSGETRVLSDKVARGSKGDVG